ncbi:MAG: hypothetical protein KF785_03050 [Gemmatimonadales bacterium]|nr:hypothetical protein [Gemmatimonadales bacterium]
MTDSPSPDFEPRRPTLVAAAVFVVAALTLCWPMLRGDFLIGQYSDMYEAGYSFRIFAANYFREYGSIPLWNPYLMGGVPFVGAGGGDIFYPTAWLRWILPTDVAINLGFAAHIVLAGAAVFALLRALRVSWAGALIGGLAFQMTGIVLSQVHPGHDGKLFVSALAPILFLAIVRAVRDNSFAGYGTIALTVGLSLHGHPQMAYYLLVAGLIWGLFWVFGPEGPRTAALRGRVILASVAVVLLGIGLYAIYGMPMSAHVAYSPRVEGTANSGWAWATSFALPLSELPGLLLPMIDGGVSPNYFGRNGLKLHTEYLGPVAIILAVLGAGGAERRRVRLALGGIAGLFLLVSLGGDTPFFRLWYAVMPMSATLRAPGMAFFLVAMPIAVLAGFGAERLFRREISIPRLAVFAGLIALLALLGLIGFLQMVVEDWARGTGYQGVAEMAIGNAGVLRTDSLRLLVVTLVAAGLIWAVTRDRIRGVAAVAAIGAVLWADLWIVGRHSFVYSPGAKVTYASDPIMQHLEQVKPPYRVYGPVTQYSGLNPYPKSWLMTANIPVLFGYHGNEIRYFNDLLGGKIAQNQLNPAMWDLFAVRYFVVKEPQQIPGFRQVLGPVQTHHGPGYLFESEDPPPYARVIAGAIKVPDDAIVESVTDQRFPIDRVLIYPDTASVTLRDLGNQVPEPSARRADVTEWRPGRMRVAISGEATQDEYLLVSENWYPDWKATIDGKPAAVLRANNTLLSVVLPASARDVVFEYDSRSYRRGRAVSLISLLGVVGIFAGAVVRRRKARDG